MSHFGPKYFTTDKYGNFYVVTEDTYIQERLLEQYLFELKKNENTSYEPFKTEKSILVFPFNRRAGLTYVKAKIDGIYYCITSKYGK